MLFPLPLHQSVLIVGASGRCGVELIHQLSQHPTKPDIHAFVRDADSFKDKTTKDLLTSIIQGNARDEKDLEWALKMTRARVVVMCVGNRKNIRSDVRASSAMALASVLRKPDFRHVNVVVVSRKGAGDSNIVGGRAGLNIGNYWHRHVISDHTRQEEIFHNQLDQSLRNRTLVVRPTSSTPPEKVAKWITSNLCDCTMRQGRGGVVNLTSSRFPATCVEP